MGYPLKKFRFDKLKITVSISNCIKAVCNYVFFAKVMKSTWLLNGYHGGKTKDI